MPATGAADEGPPSPGVLSMTGSHRAAPAYEIVPSNAPRDPASRLAAARVA
jgi:hypothetical protein